MAGVTALVAIKRYFELTMDEAKLLAKQISSAEREEMGRQAAEALGEEFISKAE